MLSKTNEITLTGSNAGQFIASCYNYNMQIIGTLPVDFPPKRQFGKQIPTKLLLDIYNGKNGKIFNKISE